MFDASNTFVGERYAIFLSSPHNRALLVRENHKKLRMNNEYHLVS